MQKAGCKQDKCGTYDGIPSVCLGAASVRSGDARVEAQLMYSRRVARSADVARGYGYTLLTLGCTEGELGVGFFPLNVGKRKRKKKPTLVG